MKGIKLLVLLVALFGFSLVVNADGEKVASVQAVDARFYSSVRGIIDTPDPLLQLAPIVADAKLQDAVYVRARSKKLQELVKAIDAIEDKEVGLTAKKKLEIADAALNAQEKTGVDAVLMIAVARMESDFRPIVMVNAACKFKQRDYGCYADCGMTQHHIRGDARYVNRKCRELAKDTKATFLYSAQEIASHVKWCSERAHQSWNRPLRRCVLNRYNMGPRYKTVSYCKRIYNCSSLVAEAQPHCKAGERKCIMRAVYWKRLTCFEYGARKLVRAAKSCRWCTNLAYINTFFYPRPTPPKSNASVAASPIKSETIRRNQPK